MEDPYKPPESSPPILPKPPPPKKREFIKYFGITFELRAYLLLQTLILSAALIVGIVLMSKPVDYYFGYKSTTIGVVALFVVIPLEIGEMIYALSRKRFTK